MRNIIKEGLPDNVNQTILGIMAIIVTILIIIGIVCTLDFHRNKKYNTSHHVQTEDR